jgi:uncharacterized membrane protein
MSAELPWLAHASVVGSSALVGFLGIPLKLQKIPPNGLYGVRMPSTLENPTIWYRVNAVAGRDMMIVGFGSAAFGAVLLLIAPLNLAMQVASGALIAGLAVAVIRSIRMARRLKKNPHAQ